MYSFHRRETAVPVTGRSVRGASSCTGCRSGCWGSVAGVGGKWGLLLGNPAVREGGNVINPSACMRSNATRQVMSLSSPLGLFQPHNSQSWRDIGARCSEGFCSISILMVWMSARLNSRPQ